VKGLNRNTFVCVPEDLFNLFKGNHVVAVGVQLSEECLKLFKGHELLSVDACHDKLAVTDLAILRLVRHVQQSFDLLFIEIVAVVFAIASDKLILGKESFTRRVECLENLLEVFALADLHKVLDQEAKSCLF